MINLSNVRISDHVWNTTFGKLFWWNGSIWTNNDCEQYTNKSGGALVEGDVVKYSSSFVPAIETSTVAADVLVAGVVVIGGAADAELTIAQRGRYYVLVSGEADAGDYIRTNGLAKQALADPNEIDGNFGRVAEEKGLGVALLLCDIGLTPETN
jgi:hypothetical protein